ncbi:MAG: hypothetical protein B6U85_03620 [Desulfurococcales archaeon ex4484_42]|nr:MAG: hypothetical protein B6U85_03620 [Desulfurococcales archaeon ex4484_42]
MSKEEIAEKWLKKALHELDIDKLHPLAIEARYPDTGVEVTINEAEEAIEKAKIAVSFITRRIKNKK